MFSLLLCQSCVYQLRFGGVLSSYMKALVRLVYPLCLIIRRLLFAFESNMPAMEGAIDHKMWVSWLLA